MSIRQAKQIETLRTELLNMIAELASLHEFNPIGRLDLERHPPIFGDTAADPLKDCGYCNAMLAAQKALDETTPVDVHMSALDHALWAADVAQDEPDNRTDAEKDADQRADEEAQALAENAGNEPRYPGELELEEIAEAEKWEDRDRDMRHEAGGYRP